MQIREACIEIPAAQLKRSKYTYPAASITYYEYGPQQPGKPVLICVHGLARNGRDFDYIANHLASDYRVISVDMPGRGKSPWQSDPMHYIYPNYLAWMIAFMDALNIRKASWLGTSMGGIIGLLIAAAYPTRIERLILNDVGSLVPKEGLRRIAGYLGGEVLRDTRAQMQDYLKRTYAAFGIEDEEQWNHLFEHSIRQTPDGKYSLTFDPAIIEPIRAGSKNFTEFTDVDLGPQWAHVKCPVLIIRGQLSDILLPATALKMLDEKPGTTLYEVENVGHAPSLMNRVQAAYIEQWLRRTPAFSPPVLLRLICKLFGH